MKKNLVLIATLAATLAVVGAAQAGDLSVSVIDKEGKPVPNAVVTLLPTNKTAQPKTALPAMSTVTQERMQFIPLVSVVPVGGKVRFVNNDAWDHHVRSSPAGLGQFNATNAGFELRLEGKTDGRPAKASEITLDKAGVVGATLLGCFIHNSMRGYVFASETPWAAKTGDDGVAMFEGVPDGATQVKVWQADQLVDVPATQVNITAAPAKTSFQLTVVPRRVRAIPIPTNY